jgi:class 3 adenylate cyclase
LKAKKEIAQLGMTSADSTVLFCDIEDFTTWTETVNPETLITATTEFMDLVTLCVEENSGLVDK